MFMQHENEKRQNVTHFLKHQNMFPFAGTLSTGKAIQYALDNILTPEAGMRDNRAPKGLGIITNTNPSEDAIGPALEARRRGIIVRVFV